MKNVKVGVIGCGAIGGKIIEELCTGKIKNMRLSIIYDIDEIKKKNFSQMYNIPAANSIREVVNNADLVVEAANKTVVKEIISLCSRKRKDVLIMSVGGIVENLDILEKVKNANINVYLPSGAIGCIDAIKSASVGKIKKIELLTIKPPKAFIGNKYLRAKKIFVENINKRKRLFCGNVSTAVKFFPENINISATILLASSLLSNSQLAKSKIKVEILCDPKVNKNIHKITIVGDAGKITTIAENTISKHNPKSSLLAIYSALATIKQIGNNIKIGT